jgi:hypothetical protein
VCVTSLCFFSACFSKQRKRIALSLRRIKWKSQIFNDFARVNSNATLLCFFKRGATPFAVDGKKPYWHKSSRCFPKGPLHPSTKNEINSNVRVSNSKEYLLAFSCCTNNSSHSTHQPIRAKQKKKNKKKHTLIHTHHPRRFQSSPLR